MLSLWLQLGGLGHGMGGSDAMSMCHSRLAVKHCGTPRRCGAAAGAMTGVKMFASSKGAEQHTWLAVLWALQSARNNTSKAIHAT